MLAVAEVRGDHSELDQKRCQWKGREMGGSSFQSKSGSHVEMGQGLPKGILLTFARHVSAGCQEKLSSTQPLLCCRRRLPVPEPDPEGN